MKSIWKYELDAYGLDVEMPIGAEILSAFVQDDKLCVWVKVDTESVASLREFRVFGTGFEIPIEEESYLQFIATCHMDNGLVWHIFELVKGE